jgi:hypothetical protein
MANTPKKKSARRRPKDRSKRHGPDYGGKSPRNARSLQRRAKEAKHQYDHVEPKEHSDQSGVPVGHVRVYYTMPNGSTLNIKIIERVAHKHDSAGNKLRPYQRVYRGHAFRTASGLQQGDIMRWKGRLVSRHAHAAAMKRWNKRTPSIRREFAAVKIPRSKRSRRSVSKSAKKATRKSARISRPTQRLNLGGMDGDVSGDETDDGEDDEFLM